METIDLKLLYGKEDLDNLNVGDAVMAMYSNYNKFTEERKRSEDIFIFAGNLDKKNSLHFIHYPNRISYIDGFVLYSIKQRDIEYISNGSIDLHDKHKGELCNKPKTFLYKKLEEITNLSHDIEELRWNQRDKQ